MDKDFEADLKGTLEEATKARDKIENHFKRYGDSGHKDANKHQLIFACKILGSICKCGDKHLDIYINIIIHTFGNQVKPESGIKYWTYYVNSVRYVLYMLVNKKEYNLASALYKYISLFNNKLQSAEIGNMLVNIYCYQLLLQNSLRSTDKKTALRNANEILDNLTTLFMEILDSNKNLNFQYPDLFKNTMHWLFPKNNIGTIHNFFHDLDANKVKRMFESLFSLYGSQTITVATTPEDVHDHAKFLLETLYTFVQVDILDKLQLQLAVNLLKHCRTECRLQTVKPIAELFLILYDYFKIIYAQKPITNLQYIFALQCERFKEFFDKYSKSVMTQPWFGELIFCLCNLHSQLQNINVFSCFWKEMCKPEGFNGMFQLFVECIKLATCITSEAKLSITCCTSLRKHVILSQAQAAMTGYAFYCQNVDPEDEKEEALKNRDNNLTDNYIDRIRKSLQMIINHAFKIIDKMDCITSTSQDITMLLTRFKQITVNVKTSRQAATCLTIFELFLKIKTKLPNNEWPLLLRRLYKTVTQFDTENPNLGRDLQMCYIASMLHESISPIDIGQIRTQIHIYYAESKTNLQAANGQQQEEQRDKCLTDVFYTTKSLFRPHLELPRKKLLHWLDSQHILRYYKTNIPLLHSLLKSSQSEYDFVITTRAAKLQTYALSKISSIYNSMSSKVQQKLGNMSRLEHLTYGHVCTILLNDIKTDKIEKIEVTSKDLNEEQLEQLLLRDKMESFTICNELKRLKFALQAFKAFEEFYEKIDNEIISMDEAIIDWESIIYDLSSIAQYLHLSGYMEYCSQVWLLLYKYSRLIQDEISALKCIEFFCEYSEFYDKNTAAFNLDNEIELSFPTITVGLENLSDLSNTQQNYILLAVLQIAYYYGRSSRLNFALTLLEYVEQKHSELPERQGRYDLIMATMDAIKFRLTWKKYEEKIQTERSSAENLLLHKCLLLEIEEIVERFHNLNSITSNDVMKSVILIINLLQEFAECVANRLCNNFVISFFVMTCKYSLQYGLALRFVQVMSMWMRINLQLEYVDKAQIKLKLIEFIMGVKSKKELTDTCAKVIVDIQSSTILPEASNDLIAFNYNPSIEATRKLAQVQLSPIKTDKLQLSAASRNYNLKNYFKCNIDVELMPQNEQLEWTLFTVGCLNARLYFLVGDYDQLEAFYEKGCKWLKLRQNVFNKQYYKNIQLMAMQHYANYLRANRKYEKALQCLEYALKLCDKMKFNIDSIYRVNFKLQLIATQKELAGFKAVKENLRNLQMPRRALKFNLSPAKNDEIYKKAQKDLKTDMLQKATSSKVKISTTVSLSTKKPILPTISVSKPKLKFDICEDSLEIIEINDDDNDTNKVLNKQECAAEELKSTKRTKTIELNEQHTTPKVPRKITSVKPTTTTKATRKYKRPSPPSPIEIDLTDSPLSSSSSSASSLISLDQLEIKENLNTNDLVKQMKNLEIDILKNPTTETKSKSHSRKPQSVKKPSSTVIDQLNKAFTNPVEDVAKTTRTRVKRDKTADLVAPEITATPSLARRQRKPALENDENQVASSSASSLISLDQLEIKENLNTNDLVKQMKNLEIDILKNPTTETKSKSHSRKPQSVKKPSSTVIDQLNKAFTNPVEDVAKTTRTRVKRDKTADLVAPEITATPSLARRQRKPALENDENQVASSLAIIPPEIVATPSQVRRQRKPTLENDENQATTSLAVSSSSCTSRRRQKI